MPVKVYALIGRSGTGKSFRAQSVAAKYHIKYIIDDGLLISGNKIIAGKSAKQEENFLKAVKCAVFQDDNHQESVTKVLNSTRFRKILIIGTSENMAIKIAQRLYLPAPKYIIHIEDIATKDEIDTAMRIRYTEGKHIIPVTPIQITRSYPKIAYSSVNVATNRNTPIRINKRKSVLTENTVVKPEFGQTNSTSISSAAFTQMLRQCLYEYENTLKIDSLEVEKDKDGYNLKVVLSTPLSIQNHLEAELTEFITDSLEKYGAIMISSLDLKSKSLF